MKKKDQIFNISTTNHFTLALFHHIILTDVYVLLNYSNI